MTPNKKTSLYERGPKCSIHNKYGNWTAQIYRHKIWPWIEHVVLVSSKTDYSKPVKIRIHSSCLFGDVLFDKACDCREQLDVALKEIGHEGGILFYLIQEGRNIGLWNKTAAYALKERGFDTVEANEYLGVPADNRDYVCVSDVLNDYGISEIIMLTNNPDKISAIEASGVKVVRKECKGTENGYNKDYLYTKKKRFNHKI